MGRYLSVQEVAELLGQSQQSAYDKVSVYPGSRKVAQRLFAPVSLIAELTGQDESEIAGIELDAMVTVAEASQISKIAGGVIRVWLGKGKIPGAVQYGRHWLVPRQWAQTVEKPIHGWPRGKPRSKAKSLPARRRKSTSQRATA